MHGSWPAKSPCPTMTEVLGWLIHQWKSRKCTLHERQAWVHRKPCDRCVPVDHYKILSSPRKLIFQLSIRNDEHDRVLNTSGLGIIFGLEADILKSIFQMRWQAIAQTNVNVIISWWTVTWNGIIWQWLKIASYDSYVQVEHDYWMLLVDVCLVYQLPQSWYAVPALERLLVQIAEYNRNISMPFHYGKMGDLLDILYLVWQIDACEADHF